MRTANAVAAAFVTLSALHTASADNFVGRIGAVGGYDASAPGHRDDGLAAGVGYRHGPWTAELDFSYLDYDGSTGIAGGATRAGVLVQGLIHKFACDETQCPHIDVDLGLGYRWVNWQPKAGYGTLQDPLNFRGRELKIGLSANFLLHLALHYVVFEPESDTLEVSCRSTKPCGTPMLPNIGRVGVMLEASFVLGGS